jgi:hypothetical protein
MLEMMNFENYFETAIEKLEGKELIAAIGIGGVVLITGMYLNSVNTKDNIVQ